MIDALFAPQSLAFAVALGLVALIALIELIGALIGLAPSAKLDSMMPDLHADGPDMPDVAGDGLMASALDWLAVGRVPIIVLVISFLTAFGLVGLLIERIAAGMTGHYISGLIAAPIAFFASLPLTRTIGLSLGRVLPKDETEAVSVEGFIGKIATITGGTAKAGLPAEAKLTDAYGKTHYIRVEPDIATDTFERGASVLVVGRTGGIFRIIAPNHNALTSN